MIAVPDIPEGDADLQLSELQVGPASVWEEVRARSKKAIDESDKTHLHEVSWHSSDLRVKWKSVGSTCEWR